MNTRLTAVLVLKDVLIEGRSLTEALTQHIPAGSESDIAFTKMLCFGTLRWYHKLDFWLNELLGHRLKPKDRDIEILLMLGIYQVAFSTKPDHACVNETVTVTRLLKKPWASKLVNGVLRNFLRKREALEGLADHSVATRFSFPAWLSDKLSGDYGEDTESLLASLQTQAPLTLRINRQAQTALEFKQHLQQNGLTFLEHPELDNAVTLMTPCNVEDIPGFYDGSCSVQDAAAQWCASLLHLQPGQRLLDACSAPGGKTAACLEMEPSLDVTAIDVDPKRQERTQENLTRLRLNANVLSANAADTHTWWNGHLFDRILLDVPCSATGVIRRHPDIKVLRRQSDIQALQKTQIALLEGLWPLLREGGHLLYSTCSLLSDENEQAVGAFLKQHPDAEHKPLPHIQGTVERPYGRQFLPQVGGHDGFYYALLCKRN
ncbi:MAG: 16S rRNA (cytosine(967)-C(5))-methyltransferase RsmB [Hahellaceae bacterium]|nr:16S rRNA (cytosine(967)-C(5))-methyltransferase RsmB [Hahellaceae bacterium]